MHAILMLLVAAPPWAAPIDVCGDKGVELVEVHEVVDPKDPTVNLREAPKKKVVAAVPVGSKVVMGERVDGEWVEVFAQPPPVLHKEPIWEQDEKVGERVIEVDQDMVRAWIHASRLKKVGQRKPSAMQCTAPR
ncbi:MAG: hypothetical protein A2138_08130 [Deltaproteobacteria bacterium RBG_16_71_12]|nr:MAG: hypothetical protein A2138_08130 [Deltaproteobacteria bacterium RBG_16_71_12]